MSAAALMFKINGVDVISVAFQLESSRLILDLPSRSVQWRIWAWEGETCLLAAATRSLGFV